MSNQTQQLIFWGIFLLFLVVVYFLDRFYNLLRDTSTLKTKKPYSFSRVQLTWWSTIILTSFITILFTKNVAPTLSSSTLVLLGISMVTTAASSAIDMSDISNGLPRSQNTPGTNLVYDILSDGNGINMHRFQTVVFNTLFGVWFIYAVLHNLIITGAVNIHNLQICPDCSTAADNSPINTIMPVICQNNLILLGLSSGTYVALKTNENKKPVDTRMTNDSNAANTADESGDAVG